MLRSFFDNTRKPKDNFWGRFMLNGMNKGHNKLALWGISFLKIEKTDNILDIGCGGGKNIENFLARTDANVYGVDYSEASVKASSQLNKKAVESGRTKVFHASVEKLPFDDESFEIASAFETIYFWPNPIENFKEVRRILKPNGKFLIVNEMNESDENSFWEKIIEMKVYSSKEITNFLEIAGFKILEFNEKGKNISIIAQK
ncbi:MULTISPECIES: class I SAM-dependent methyltransferase [Peptoniphilus]|uniref:class I SAM-dependent methyltransferase n=1 Tax=Peptoniphilus TaxID=162289 RepID=UPI0001DAA16A|nr:MULTISPECIES: class I SAM-dependent methyltransferase [Peptoniphilus]EFI41699.1 methyltransferase domain protein [Peptoniphilus sp. oral taxon 386 str. F0131]